MPTFRYSAVDRSRRAAAGTLDAPSRREAIRSLAADDLFVTELHESTDGMPEQPAEAATPSAPSAPAAESAVSWMHRRVTPRSRTAMLAQLAAAVEAGLPLLSSLRAVEQQAESPALRELVGDLADRVQSGEPLSDAMAEHPRTFSPLHVSMARAGETAGVLDEVLASMADFGERELEVREKIRSAATYPAIVLALAAVSVAVILAFILPRILDAVSENVATLPLPTRLLMGASDLMRSWGWLIVIAAILGGWAFRSWLGRPEGRLAFDRFKLRIPVLGDTLRKSAVARFARTLGTLSRSGIQVLEALRVLRDTLGNEAMGRQVDEVRSAVTQGQSIAEPLQRTGQFPPMFIQVIALGERTGRLDEMLLRVADAYDRETTASIQRTMTVLPALFIVVMALVVAFILLAVLLPIFQMNTMIPGA